MFKYVEEEGLMGFVAHGYRLSNKILITLKYYNIIIIKNRVCT